MDGRGRRIGLVLAALIAVTIGVIALVRGGDDGTTSVNPQAVAEAAERTSRVEGLRYEMTGEMALPDVGKVTFTGDGVEDLRGKRGTAHMDMSEMADRLKESGESGAPGPDAWKMDMVFDRETFYMKSPLIAPELDGKTWMKFDLVEVAKSLGVDPSLVRSDQQQGDPTSTLRYLRAVSDDVERFGTEEVRGVESTHYRATIDLRKYPNLVPAGERDQVRRSVDRLIELNGGDPTSQMEVWVGGEYVRRMKWDQTMKPPGQNQPLQATYMTEFFDFGTDVRIKVPDDSDTKDVTEEAAAQAASER